MLGRAHVLSARAPRAAVLLVPLLLAAGCGGGGPALMDRAALLDPENCKTCHPTHYDEWAGSMHAYASDDPVFRAMNARGQHETNGALGDFCVQCHAPVALRDGLTTDGLNLDQLPQKVKGVTCYFCHAAKSIEGTHNAQLTLAADDSLFGPFGDPVGGTPHRALYSALLDDTQRASADACGTCHDIVNTQGAPLERTYAEWQGTLFAKPPHGLTCTAGCHMDARDGPASTTSPSKTRRLHTHDFPAVDLALVSTPLADDQRRAQQAARTQAAIQGAVLQSSVCLNPITNQVRVTLDNVGVGHNWPSGATQDRRAWVELTAFAGGAQIYSSGGEGARPLEGSSDPDLWLIRDCMFDSAGNDVKMFWQAASVTSNQIHGAVTASVTDMATFGLSHAQKSYPSASGASLPASPDRITLKVHLQAMGDDVLQDLVDTGYLDPALPSQIARFELTAAALEWTPATATPMNDPSSGNVLSCVFTSQPSLATTPGTTHRICTAPPPP